MKYIISLIIVLFFSASSVNANNLENKMSKQVVITKYQIEKDYKDGKQLNKKLENIFIKFRYFKDITTLDKINSIVLPKIQELSKKEKLSRNEKKTLNLYKNIYYRSILLSNYHLK